MSKTSVILAVRDTDLRLSLDLMLRDEHTLNVLGTASTLGSTIGLVGIERPDLILQEMAMSDLPIEEMLEEIKAQSPNSKVILLGNRADQESPARKSGADAYLRIGGAPESLRSTIKDLFAKDKETLQAKE